MLSERLRVAVVVSIATGLAAAVAGLRAARWEILPTGPLIALVLFALFVLAYAGKMIVSALARGSVEACGSRCQGVMRSRRRKRRNALTLPLLLRGAGRGTRRAGRGIVARVRRPYASRSKGLSS